MAEPKKQVLPEERFPIPESLSGLFQKKELNDKHLWLVGTLTRHITRQDEGGSLKTASSSHFRCYIKVMKNLTFLLLLLTSSILGWAKTACIDEIALSSDSISAVVHEEPEHYTSAFNAQQLESATKTKYIGGGISLAGLILASQGNTDGGILVSVLGGVIGFFGRIGQDIQLVRLGRKHENPSPSRAKSSGLSPVRSDCSDTNLSMGDNVSFQAAGGISITAEIIGIVSNPLGCQIIVAYELNGERNTSTLAPESLTKI